MKHYTKSTNTWQFYIRHTPQGLYFLAVFPEDSCDWLRTLELSPEGTVSNEVQRIERVGMSNSINVVTETGRINYTETGRDSIPETLVKSALQYKRDHQLQAA